MQNTESTNNNKNQLQIMIWLHDVFTVVAELFELNFKIGDSLALHTTNDATKNQINWVRPNICTCEQIE